MNCYEEVELLGSTEQTRPQRFFARCRLLLHSVDCQTTRPEPDRAARDGPRELARQRLAHIASLGPGSAYRYHGTTASPCWSAPEPIRGATVAHPAADLRQCRAFACLINRVELVAQHALSDTCTECEQDKLNEAVLELTKSLGVGL